jgi:RimJ/RimL family protein N-acetyltransferase
VEDGIIVERTFDLPLVRRLATDPAIFPFVSDDHHSDPEKWQPLESEIVRQLVASDDQGYFGFGIFIPDTWTAWKAHIGFLPRSYGEKAHTSFRKMLDWMWANTEARRIVGEISVENRKAIHFAKRCGFKEYGVNEKSKLKGGVLLDQVCLGISKPQL